jgi:queuine tRNA-ribosyltransferase
MFKNSRLCLMCRTLLNTAHGVITTRATVKAIKFSDINNIGAEIILGNIYRLYLRPGIEKIKSFGGLHKFTGWNKPILTDSGDYQVSHSQV